VRAEDPAAGSEAVEGLPPGWGGGFAGRAAFAIAIAFSAFQLWVAAFGALPSQVVRAVHVGFLLLLGFALLANLVARTPSTRILLWGFGIAGFATGIYQWAFYAPLIQRAGFLNPPDLAAGVVLIVLVFEAARRLMGWPLAVIAGVFLAYAAFGNFLPAPLVHRGYSFDQIVEHFAFGTEGIYGTPVYVSSAYIFLFVLFAAFLERAGMIAFFNDLALGLVGAARGGPAQVCVLSSALMGTISGSGVANVVASGQFTIPLMKRFGFSAAFAGGVEATSSMGGQIMPPVMGAVAFIMAETLNVAYAEIVRAAVIPALLYFGVCFWSVYLEAGKAGLRGMERASLPDPVAALRAHWPLILPLAVLVWLLFAGFTPVFAGAMGLALVVVLILAAPFAALIGPFAFRLAFWIAIGAAAAGFLKFGAGALAALIGALALGAFFFAGGRRALAICRDSLAEGARNALPVGIACAIVGVVIGTLTLTGAASTFIGAVIRIGEENLFLSLLLTMATCLVLGMGIPTIPNYIITSSLAGPALLELGVPLIVSHMFVFYFGIMADLTPPVALACFAAAPIAKTSGLRISLEAVKLAIAGFVVPFIAVYAPSLMLQGGGPLAASLGYPADVAFVVARASAAVMLWGAAFVGYLFAPLPPAERLAAFLAGALLAAGSLAANGAGFAIAAAFLALHILRLRAPSRRAAP
jgi:TRAP transporter 4TM/12TM fusion protein